MFQNVSVGKKVVGGFVFCLLILGLVLVESISAMKNSSDGFIQYRKLAADSHLASAVQSELMAATTSVRDFIITREEERLKGYAKHWKKITELVEEARKDGTDSDREMIIEEMAANLAQFNDTVDKIILSQADHQRLLNSIAEEGEALEQEIKTLLQLGGAENDPQALTVANAAVMHILSTRLYAARFIIYNDQRSVGRARLEMTLMKEGMEELSDLVQAPGKEQVLSRFSDMSDNYRKTFDSLVSVIFRRNALIRETIDRSGALVAANIREIVASVEAEQVALGSALQDGNSRSVTFVTTLSFAAFVIGSLLALAITRGITTPLGETVRAAERIANGDLSGEVTFAGRGDEIGELGKAFSRMNDYLRETAHAIERIADGDLSVEVSPLSTNDAMRNSVADMISNLRDLTREIQTAVRVLATSISQISATTSQLSASASETAASINETTTTMEEVKQTATLSSDKARTMAERAQKAAQVSQAGRKSTEDVGSAMAQITQKMDFIAQNIVSLSEKSQTIGDIITAVNDIADQSNILAVNASIEAARAGEEGRGFAVVAQEIRSLSEQSKASTSQVRDILADIQKATSSAVMVTEEGTKAVAAGEQQTTHAGEAIGTLAASVSDAARASAQIVASSQEQLAGIEQVAVALSNIREASGQNMEGASQLDNLVKDLDTLAGNLKSLVDRYKV